MPDHDHDDESVLEDEKYGNAHLKTKTSAGAFTKKNKGSHKKKLGKSGKM